MITKGKTPKPGGSHVESGKSAYKYPPPPPVRRKSTQPPHLRILEMSSLETILNIDILQADGRPALARGRHPLMSASPSGLPDGEGATLSGDANYAPRDVDYYAPSPESRRPHAPHPDCPDTLACLPDSEGRPQHTLPVILRCAILGSPHKRLTIREIYSAMEVKYPWYRTAGPTWKQSVRHHLSLNRLFEKVPRPATDPGFGSYWTCNLQAPTGTKRPRKRGRNARGEGQDSEDPSSLTTKPRTRIKLSPTVEVPDAFHHPFPGDAHAATHALTLSQENVQLPLEPSHVAVQHDSSAPHGHPFDNGPPPSASHMISPSDPPCLIINGEINSYPTLPVHVVYPTIPTDGTVASQPHGRVPTPNTPPAPSQVEILQALVGRLNSDVATVRWQAETLGVQVGRLTEELGAARAAAHTAEAMLAEEVRKRVNAEAEIAKMKREMERRREVVES